MRPSQIQAVDHIVMEAHPSTQEGLIWFYRDLVGLELSADYAEGLMLSFQSARIRLEIRLMESPRVHENGCRLVVSVRDLEWVGKVLEAERIAYQPLSGMTWTDRRLTLLDPGGNRVELKQEWRRGVFSGDPPVQPATIPPAPKAPKKHQKGG